MYIKGNNMNEDVCDRNPDVTPKVFNAEKMQGKKLVCINLTLYPHAQLASSLQTS